VASSLSNPSINTPAERLRLPPERQDFFFFLLGSQRPRIAPVGSVMMLSEPAPFTLVTSFFTFAPRDFAFLVAALTSPTFT